MEREYRVISRLRAHFAYVPQAVFFCHEHESPFGAPFFVMERVRGRILRTRNDDLTGICDSARALMRTLADLHAVDHRASGLADLGRPDGYIRRQVRGWTDRYLRARTHDIREMDRLAEWLATNGPRDGEPSLIHNDYKFDNVVFDPSDPSSVRCVLDWEMATVGDPKGDLGTTLAYWFEPDDPSELLETPFAITASEGNLTRLEALKEYVARFGRDVGSVRFHYVLGAFKIAVIAQQLYARFAAGLTTDARFATLPPVVRGLAVAGCREISMPKLP
jgi:aminoglycoside phosphotransferase (APT) family kinase protein